MPPDPTSTHTVDARPSRHRRWWPVAFVLLGSILLSACDYWPIPASTSNGAVAKGQFVIQCKTAVRSAADDPIVYPNQPGAAHLHEFYGNQAVRANSSSQSLQGQPTGCAGTEPGDTAAYWHPTLFVNGTRTPAASSSFYYTNRDRKPNDVIRAHPAGLKIIAGDHMATAPQGTDVVYWGCGDGGSASKVERPPQCRAGDDGLTLHVIFPDCWNGRDLDSVDHKRHMAYSRRNGDGYQCPPSHPVSLPTMIMRIRWSGNPAPSSLRISSGSVDTMHADFWNTWNQPRLEQLTRHCVTGGRDCDEDARQALPAR